VVRWTAGAGEVHQLQQQGSIASSGATGRIRGIPQSASMKVTERFTRLGEKTIDYRVTIDDPKV
jgi:hypothetical protein